MCLLSCLGGTESVSAGCFHSSLPLQLKNSTHLSAMLTYTAHSYIHAQCNYITTYSAVHFIYFHTEGRRGRDEREREREVSHGSFNKFSFSGCINFRWKWAVLSESSSMRRRDPGTERELRPDTDCLRTPRSYSVSTVCERHWTRRQRSNKKETESKRAK